MREGRPYEENPFEDPTGAIEWTQAVEGERGEIRDRETYPRLSRWVESTGARTIAEIGSGQGICAEQAVPDSMRYVGIEPSLPLVKRAQEAYAKENREFVVGNAYDLPLADASVDAAFSVNVWFHLENLERASRELARILRPSGKFLISTPNPDEYQMWESFYQNVTREGKKLTGAARVPGHILSKSIFYQHSMEEIENALEQAHLRVEKKEKFGYSRGYSEHPLFIDILGAKGK